MRYYLDEVDLGHAALEHVLAGVGGAGLVHVGQHLVVGVNMMTVVVDCEQFSWNGAIKKPGVAPAVLQTVVTSIKRSYPLKHSRSKGIVKFKCWPDL